MLDVKTSKRAHSRPFKTFPTHLNLLNCNNMFALLIGLNNSRIFLWGVGGHHPIGIILSNLRHFPRGFQLAK